MRCTTFTLNADCFGLPAGTRITAPNHDPLRASWGVETPTARGYISRGSTLSKAIRHALSGQPEQAIASLEAHGRAASMMAEAIFGRPEVCA